MSATLQECNNFAVCTRMRLRAIIAQCRVLTHTCTYACVAWALHVRRYVHSAELARAHILKCSMVDVAEGTCSFIGI